MVSLYAARMEDLGPGDFVKVDCGVCQHTALVAPAFLSRLRRLRDGARRTLRCKIGQNYNIGISTIPRATRAPNTP
jgi:hypothetical protein